MVLRRKPSGTLLKPAHQVEREYRVISALQGMAALHNVDWEAAGLADFGRPGNYILRQLDRWSRQYRNTAVDGADPLVEEITSWLEKNPPAEAKTTLAHGDFRLGNLVFDELRPVVRALLDWELSTLGDPLGDLAYCCLPCHLPAEGENSKGLRGFDLKEQGIPAEEELLAAYCSATGRSGIDGWTFYLVFSLFGLIAILQGVYARALQGNASSANALSVAARRKVLARTAADMIAGK